MKSVSVLLLSFLLLPFLSLSQEIKKQDIKALARPYKSDSIYVRWAPTDAVSWHYLNQYGYKIQRVTMVRDGKVLDPLERQWLDTTYLPKTEEELMELLQEDTTNKYLGVVAQALYGEMEENAQPISGDFMAAYQRSKAQKMMFGFALFSADMNQTAALASGVGFVDRNTLPNERYLYLIMSKVPQGKRKIDTGYIFTGNDQYMPLPQPYDLQAEWKDKEVVLNWDVELLGTAYTAYFIEKSSDSGKTFHQLNENPFTGTTKVKKRPLTRYYYSDSLAENNVEYHYRIRGISPFAEYGPYSDTIIGTGKAVLQYKPELTEAIETDSGVWVKWTYPEEGIPQVKGFTINKSPSVTGFQKDISPFLADTVREFLDTAPFPSNYYRITVTDIYGDEYPITEPIFSQATDSTPPLPPVGLSGEVSDSGIVTIQWAPNTEMDVFGYRVFRSHNIDGTYVQITNEIIPYTSFFDTIPIKVLNKKIYYKVKAVDRRYNNSALSEPLTLKRPDVIPPIKPIFTSIISDSLGLRVNWIYSPSKDVKEHRLYYRKLEAPDWELKQTFYSKIQDGLYDDINLEPKVIYEYRLVAEDSAGNIAQADHIVKGEWKGFPPKPIKRIWFQKDNEKKTVTLEWQYDKLIPVEVFYVYRKDGNNKYRLLQTLAGDQRAYTDESVKQGHTYLYSVKTVLNTGENVGWSKEVKVVF